MSLVSCQYEPLIIAPCDNLLGVFAIAGPDGQPNIATHPVHAIGMARVTHPPGTAPIDEDTQIVGYELLQGSWHVVQEANNFIGLCHRDDLEKDKPYFMDRAAAYLQATAPHITPQIAQETAQSVADARRTS